jgi:hypothetical protein
LSESTKELLRTLKELNENIDFLTKVVALSVRKDSLFSGKETKQQQIEKLEPLDLPDRIVAVIVGSTADSVKALRSQSKKKGKKTEQTSKNKEIERDVQQQIA